MQQTLIAFFRAAFLRQEPHRFAVMQPQSADRKYNDHPGQLTDDQLAAHLDGRAAYAVPTAENGLASLLPLDVDAGGVAAIAALLDAAQARGLWAFAQYDPAAGRGYVFVPFDDLTNAERIRAMGDELLASVQPQAHGWRVENRATNEDTRLPFARHRWTGKRGVLEIPGGQLADLDQPAEQYAATLERFMRAYRENPTSALPPPPDTTPAPPRNAQERPRGPGVTIADYNARTDLVALLESFGARRARGHGARLYFCPFHGDAHASLLITRDGERCKCLSQGSDCPLSGHLYDPFNVFCTGERLTTAQALRRLNGHPDDPEPQSGPQTPPAAPRNTRGVDSGPQATRTAHRAGQGQRNTPTVYPASRRPASDAVGPSQDDLDLPTTASDGRRLPKTCRRALDVIAQHPGGYIRGKYHLARLLDCDPRTVQRSLRRLEAEGLICRQERGRDGQTDIYQLAHRRPTMSAPTHAEQPAEGRQLPPTVVLEIHPIPKALEAERGGQATPGDDSQADGLALPDPDGAQHGPGGAVAYPGGAAYVPPEAEQWYEAQQAATRSATLAMQRYATPEEPEPQQEAIPEPEPPSSPPPRKRRRNRTATAYVDPGKLHGRIIAAERKAAKLEATGKAKDRAQARAIRRSAEDLKRQLEAQRERYTGAEDTEAEGPPQAQDDPQPGGFTAAEPPTAPPVSSLSGVDWRYLEVLAQAGELHGIETHCRLYRGDVAEVCAELVRRGYFSAGRGPYSPVLT